MTLDFKQYWPVVRDSVGLEYDLFMTQVDPLAVHAPDNDPTRPQPMAWEQYSYEVREQWVKLLDSNPEESAIQSFLELHPAMIPGGSGDIGPGGHHGSQLSAVFRQPKLSGAGQSYVPDFMWVTKSSSLITPILIEIEKPSKRWFNKDGTPTAHFTQAKDQLDEWRSWFAEGLNPSLFRQKYMFGDQHLNRQLQPHFLLIYGRASEFTPDGGHRNPDALLHKRGSKPAPDETFMTFDSVKPRYDHQNTITVSMTTNGPVPFAFSPVFHTHGMTGQDAQFLGDPEVALQRSVMMSAERKAYLSQRWGHWKSIGAQRRDPHQPYAVKGGLE